MTRTGSGPRAAAGSRRKVEIISTATSLFHEKGYHETSLDDIAERVGFSKPAIYYYFKSKDDILFAIVDRIVADALERIREIANRAGSVTDRLRALLTENTKVILENLEANTVFYASRGLLTPERERDVRDREREYTAVVRELYAEGVRAGELRDIDPAVATATLLGASIWTYRWFDPKGRLPIDQVAAEVAEMLLEGVRL